MRRGESGQAVVEFALIAIALFILTIGLFDVSRAFFQYNDVASLARFGARFGGVIGGNCSSTVNHIASSSDWCNQYGSGGSSFWSIAGNTPRQGNASCPTSYSGVSSSNSYQLSDYLGTSSTTIVGAIAHRFDTSSSSSGFVAGSLTPAISPSNVWVCIQLPSKDYPSSTWTVYGGDTVAVTVYTQFRSISALITSATIPLIATSEYEVE